jgi:PAS domain S-box-containing protein
MFHSLIETLPLGIIVLSADGKIIEFNGVARTLSGYNNSNLTGSDFYNLFFSEVSADRVERGTSKELEDRVKGINGNEIRIEWSAIKLSDNGGEMLGIMKVVTDIKTS